MRNIFALLIAFTLGTTGSLAQTIISNYKPGVTSEGAVYYLPGLILYMCLSRGKKGLAFPRSALCLKAECSSRML